MQFMKWLGRAPGIPRLWNWGPDTSAILQGWIRRFGGVFLIFILSRLAFYAVAFLSSGMMPHASAWPGWVQINDHIGITLHWRWDAIYYYCIAVGGYTFLESHPLAGAQPGMLPAFFPLYPLLVRVAATVLGGLRAPAVLPINDAERSVLVAGVLVGNGAALLALWLLYQLTHEETRDEETAQRAALYTAVFPFAFYYTVPYAEPLFLATSIGTFLAARRGNWVRAGLWAAAASATRPMGMLLLPALALELILAWRRGEIDSHTWPRALLGLCLAPIGLLLFMLHLWQIVGNPLAFVEAQAYWHRERVFPIETLWRGLGYALHPSRSDRADAYVRTVLNTLTLLVFMGVMGSSLRRWRPSYVLYGLLLFTMSLSQPWAGQTIMDSTGRYVMVLFPVYISLACWGRRLTVHQTIMLLWLPLYSLLAGLYVRWLWVG